MMIFLFIIGLATVVFLYLAFDNVFKPMIKVESGKAVKLPEQRPIGLIIDGKFGDIVQIRERSFVGSDGMVFKVLTDSGEEQRRYKVDEVFPLSKKQSIAGIDTPIWVTVEFIMKMIDADGGKNIKDSGLLRDVIVKNKQLSDEIESYQLRVNTLESSMNLATDDILNKMAMLQRGLTPNMSYVEQKSRVQ